MNLISIHHDRQTRRAYWIEINQRECPPVPRFMSAPLFGNGRVDYSNKSPIGDMETMEPFNCFSESPRPIAEDYKNFQKRNQDMMERYGKELVKGKDGKYTL